MKVYEVLTACYCLQDVLLCDDYSNEEIKSTAQGICNDHSELLEKEVAEIGTYKNKLYMVIPFWKEWWVNEKI